MQESAPIHPLRLAHEINQFLTDNTLFIGDGGDVVTFSGGVVQPKGPGLWMDPGPLGTLGVGVPFAMAAKVARPDLEVVGLFGDGALSLTGWDFETMVRFNLPFIGVVGNNSHMNQIRYGQIQSRILDLHGQRMLDGAFDPGFKLHLHRKDLAIALQLGREVQMPLLATGQAAGLMDALLAQGAGEQDHSALALVYERLSGLAELAPG
jgi:signal peptidase I